MQVIDWSAKWTGMKAAIEVICSIKSIAAWLVQTYRPERHAWHYPNSFPPHLISRPVLRHGKTKQNTAATNLARSWNDPDHNMLTLLPSVIMSNWSSYDCRCTNIHKEINCHPFGAFPPVIERRLQQSAPLSYSRYYLPQIEPHYYFQLSGFPSCFVALLWYSLSILKDFADSSWSQWY